MCACLIFSILYLQKFYYDILVVSEMWRGSFVVLGGAFKFVWAQFDSIHSLLLHEDMFALKFEPVFHFKDFCTYFFHDTSANKFLERR